MLRLPRLPVLGFCSNARGHCLFFRGRRAGSCVFFAHNEKQSLVLGIESSCDDTGVAVVNGNGQILGEALAGQADIHMPWGGVVPKLAEEAHQAAIDKVAMEALAMAGVNPGDLDAVAVTIGPGLGLCLRVGVMKARKISHAYSLPLVPIHHMEAHALVARLNVEAAVRFPFLCLLVSGGHNLLLIVHNVGRYTQLGTTLDDSLGEAYDKVARLLGLELRPSGGAALEAFAREGDPQKYGFKVPMEKYRNCDFSYSGLKTSVRLAVEKLVGESKDASNRQVRADIAASFQYVAVQHLEDRCARACQSAGSLVPDIRALVISGGVASNKLIRERLQGVAQSAGLDFVCPPPRLCTDNGVMVAWAGLERFRLGLYDPPSVATPQEDDWVDIRPRWPLTDDKISSGDEYVRIVKKKRLCTSLTTLTSNALQSMEGASRQTAIDTSF